MIRTHLAYIRTTMRLVLRDRTVLFFNYFLPILFFVVFGQTFGANRGGAITQVITMVLILGVLGSGFFGAGLRAVAEREQNILRRFKVAPITPLPILMASMVTGLLAFLPSVFLILAMAHFGYSMPWPDHWLSLVLLLSIGLVSFRSVGLIIGSVANSMQESQIIIQLLYLPMLFLSGATFPISILPSWLQIVAQFLPASYLYTGLQGVLIRNEGLLDNMVPVLAMAVTVVVATFLGMKLFRWEKDEKMPGSAKFWLAAVLLPFLALGAYQSYSKENVSKAKLLYREMRRNRALLVRGPRIFTGEGKVIPTGGVLIRNGRIERIYEGEVPEGSVVKAETVEAVGKTLLPGLIDVHVHLLAPGGVLASTENVDPEKLVSRALAAYLYSGVVAVKSVGDAPSVLESGQRAILSGDKLGAELLHSGRMFTTVGGHGTEYFKDLPEASRGIAERETLFLPKTPDEARKQVGEAKGLGASAIKVILDAGQPGMLFNRLDTGILNAIVDEAKKYGLPVAVHTGAVRDIEDAVNAGASVIEHGSVYEAIPDALFAEMVKRGVAFDPTLSVVEAISMMRRGDLSLLDRTLVQQAAPPGMIAATRKAFRDPKNQARYAKPMAGITVYLDLAMDNLKRAWQTGVTLVTGTDSGNFLLIHGPSLHRELQLWVRAGLPAEVALQAATANSARLLGIGNRVGRIHTGYDASMLLVDGNPLEGIEATERISTIFFKGERVNRAELFEDD